MYVRPRPRFRPRNAGGVPFSPALLFTSGVAGAWYDPSDINNYMAGLGPELVAPIDFNTGWTASGAAITVNSATSFTSAGVSNYYNTPFTVGRWYAVTINATFTGSSLNLYNAASATNQITPLGLTSGVAQTFYFLALATQFNIRQSSAGTVTVNSIAVAELTGIANATLFQDSAGTTPVTAVEQPVGLMLDKSQGLVLGSERVGATWLGTDATWSQSGSTLTAVNGTSFSIYQTIVPAGSSYRVTFEIFDYVSGTLNIRLGNAGSIGAAANFNANGTYTMNAPAAGDGSFYWMGNNTFTGKIRNISVKSLPGNHASQATAASRPILRARYNLLTYSEQFDNAAWTKAQTTVSANAVTAPDGTTTADKMIETAVSNVHGAYQTFTYVSGATYSASVYAKQAERSWIYLGADTSAAESVFFDLANGTVGAQGTGYVGSIQSVGDGWYRCTVTITQSTALPPNYFVIGVTTANNTTSYLGDITKGIYIWGADLRTGSSAGTYQRIAAATDYATAGFLPYLYFVTDDSFSTNSIDFTATDKMSVCAGITKNNDSSVGVLVELSTTVATTAGSFAVYAPNTGANYQALLNGSTLAGRSATTYTAPITNVLYVGYDIAQSTTAGEITARVNGVTPTLTDLAGPAGTGNFGNWPLYIGRRANTLLPFDGRIYQMIVCGKTLSASELASTEAYVNSKTGAY